MRLVMHDVKRDYAVRKVLFKGCFERDVDRKVLERYGTRLCDSLKMALNLKSAEI
jgi:hypothetical protein